MVAAPPQEIVNFTSDYTRSTVTMGNIDWFSEHGPILPTWYEDLVTAGTVLKVTIIITIIITDHYKYYHCHHYYNYRHHYRQVPIIIGENSVEGLGFAAAEVADPSLLTSYNDIWDEVGTR